MFFAERLKPLRDFFLVLFFFSLGAGFDVGLIGEVVLPAGEVGEAERRGRLLNGVRQQFGRCGVCGRSQ